MARIRTTLVLALAAFAVTPAAAVAKPSARPLKDVAPLGSDFKDRVTSSNPRVARASVSGTWNSYPTGEGTTIAAAVSDRYAQSSLNTGVVQSYVDFLASLEHGPELPALKMYIAPPAEVLSECGGQDGTLACYDSSTKIMVVPGEEPNTGSSGVTLSYVVAHEYGHHVAASRNNQPFNAFRVGPKYWASYELVCDRALKGQLAPGNEQELYLSNPGEGWAETYAQLKYPGIEWQYNQLMKPDAAAFEAATRDVLEPWSGQASQVFKGTFGQGGKSFRQFKFDLTLDGSLRVRLKGPRKSNYNLQITSNGRNQGTTKNSGSRDSFNYQAACRQEQVEHVTITVRRVKGSGPFTLRLSYAG